MSSVLILAGSIVGAVILLIVFLCSIYRVADVDKALIITGGKEPVIKVSGGSFVIPIFRKAQYFDLCMLTVPADGDEIKTKTAVPIIVDWTAQIRPNTNDLNSLKKAIVSFKERGNDGITEDVKLTLMGAVRGVVANMTPEQVQNDKDSFRDAIIESVSDELTNMGLELVSLNIQDITDDNGYYDDIAAIDREAKRREAEKVKATTDQQIREQMAVSEEKARNSELASELAIAATAKDNDLKKAAFKIETDKAKADAEVAGALQRTIRQQEVAEQEGRVEVVRQEQANLAAIKRKEVVATEAEAEAERARIEAEADAKVNTIQADTEVTVAKRNAEAIKVKAEAEAARLIKEGQAAADVERQKGLAAAEISKKKGLAEAEVAREKGMAEAEAEKARLLAQAEGERALADARASNEKVNFEIEKLRIEYDAKIQIATKTAEIMAGIGQNAEFVNIGGSTPGGTGNVLIDTLSGIPTLMKTLNAENEALNGKTINDELNGLVSSIAGPIKGILSTSETNNS